MARGQLMCSSSKKAFVYVTKGYRVMGVCRLFFLFRVWTKWSSQMCEMGNLSCSTLILSVCGYKNVSRQIHTHAHIRTCITLPIWKKQPSALGKSLNVQKVNLLLCVTLVVLWTAAQKGCLHSCETVTQSILLQGRDLFPTKGFVGKEKKKPNQTLERCIFCSVASHNSTARGFSWQARVKGFNKKPHSVIDEV